MVSDAVFLSEVEAFLATCELSATKCDNELQRKHSISNPDSQDTRTTGGEKQETNDHATGKDKSYYRRRKMERINLRQQVRDLAATLEKLQRTSEMTKSSMWMSMAKYQKQERLNAEEKQRRLSAAIDARAAMIQEFFKLVQSHFSVLGGITEEEAQLIEGRDDSSQSGPFKRIRVDPPLDETLERYVNELDQTDKSTSGGESENEVWRDSGQDYDQSDNNDPEGSTDFVDNENGKDLISVIHAVVFSVCSACFALLHEIEPTRINRLQTL
ncbi:hypothetical protein L914_20605 [Phytophthora nicotianae]|uniref:Uncharacterized protein n=1 Tax=Phytophthora nicotianae TaxID=4792 RepID=W2M8N9_PHYNI|nr:hypothetical protein L914_20605 [Phytophthora nicotianae]